MCKVARSRRCSLFPDKSSANGSWLNGRCSNKHPAVASPGGQCDQNTTCGRRAVCLGDKLENKFCSSPLAPGSKCSLTNPFEECEPKHLLCEDSVCHFKAGMPCFSGGTDFVRRFTCIGTKTSDECRNPSSGTPVYRGRCSPDRELLCRQCNCIDGICTVSAGSFCNGKGACNEITSFLGLQCNKAKPVFKIYVHLHSYVDLNI